MRFGWLAAAAAVLVMSGASEEARAADLIVKGTIDTDGNIPLTSQQFQKFDPSLGTLRTVGISGTVQYRIGINALATDSGNDVTSSYFANVTTTPTATFGSLIVPLYLSPYTSSQSVTGVKFATFNLSGTGGAFTGNGLSYFTCNGVCSFNSPDNYAVPTSASIGTYTITGTEANGRKTGYTDYGAELIYNYTIDYGYEAFGAVPEPASWALMILGFGAVGGALRRRPPIARVTAVSEAL